MIKLNRVLRFHTPGVGNEFLDTATYDRIFRRTATIEKIDWITTLMYERAKKGYVHICMVEGYLLATTIEHYFSEQGIKVTKTKPLIESEPELDVYDLKFEWRVN